MTHKQIVKHVSKLTDIDQETVGLVLRTFYSTVLDRLLFGVEVKLRGFANFLIKTSPAGSRMNPQTGESIEVPKRYRIKVVLPSLFLAELRKKKVY